MPWPPPLKYMFTNRKSTGLIVIIIGLILIGLIVYFGFLRKTPTAVDTTPGALTPGGAQLPTGPTVGTTTPGDTPRNFQQYDLSKEPAHQTDAEDLAKIAMSFAERLGSFSSQSNYGNFTDLKIFMTESFREWADKYVAEQKSQAQQAGAYYGIVTQALTATVKNFDAAAKTARITVATERRESSEKINGGNAFRQNIDITFSKVNDDWLVDAAYWEK